MRYLDEIREDERVIEHFLCKEKQSLKSRNGKTYYSLKLQDKTGTIDGKVWDLNKDIQSFDKNDYIKIDALVVEYQGSLQLKINKIRKSSEGEYDPKDYTPTTKKDINDLYNKLLEIINSISDKNLKQVLKNIFTVNEQIKSNIKTHSAAKSMHHSYLGGLLEHTIEVTDTCDLLSKKYEVNRDVLIAGALLHDIGKIFELSTFPENDYTDEGQLIGHLIIGVELLTEESKKVEGTSEELIRLIKHCIISHHGELLYGSPKKPAIVEAYILHIADNLDAKIKMFENAIANNSTNSKWVGYNKMLETNVRRSIVE